MEDHQTGALQILGSPNKPNNVLDNKITLSCLRKNMTLRTFILHFQELNAAIMNSIDLEELNVPHTPDRSGIAQLVEY